MAAVANSPFLSFPSSSIASISVPQISTPSCFSTPSQFLFESVDPCLHDSSRLLAAACLSTSCSTEGPSDPDATADMSGDPRVPGAVCRINALPDDMLLLILSYLNACQVVQTCMLSRQWRNLWRSVPRINATPVEFEHMFDDYEEDTVLFKKFVNRFLMLRNPFALDEFQLLYDMPQNTYEYAEDANLWICHALRCNARSIRVTVRHNTMHLDPSVFISGLSGITDLDFSYGGNTMLNMGNIQWCPKFNNLTTLTLSQWCLHLDFYPLIVFLQNSPSLENPTLELSGVGHAHQGFVGKLEERSFSCEHLDSVDIVCWGIEEHDPVLDNLVELLTENGIEHDDIGISF